MVTKKQILGIKRRFWLYILLGFSALMILIIAPQGRLQQNSDDWQGIMPSGLFEPDEDGSSYGYSDRCGNDVECRTCKSNLTCLQCMDKCYNRYGAFYNKSNPRLSAAMLCNSKCVDVAEKVKVDADLRFANPD